MLSNYITGTSGIGNNNTLYSGLTAPSLPKNVYGNSLQTFWNGLVDGYYSPISGYYDARETSSPSYSPVNFINDHYAPVNFDDSPVEDKEQFKQQTTAPAVSGLPVQPETFDYLNAELAKHYGMSKETAYQEALSNTSYQRAIKDMQAAGLNPAAMFGSGKAAGADGVSYVSSAAPAGSGGATARSTAKKENLFSSGVYHGISAAVGLIAGIISKSPTGYWIGSQATQGLLGAINSAYQNSK